MKKIILAAVVILTATITSYTKNNLIKTVNPVSVKITADDSNKLGLSYNYHTKMDISQADGSN